MAPLMTYAWQRANKVLPRAKHLLLAACVAISLACLAKQIDGPNPPAKIIETLEADDKGHKYGYYDMHGNACEHLQALMRARFKATADITLAIDRLQGKQERADLVQAFYKTLGFVKDPASIPWLQQKVAGKDIKEFYETWLPDWRYSHFDGVGSWPWLEGRERWIPFFIDVYSKESDSTKRTELLLVLRGFDDPDVVRFFQEQGRLQLAPKETLTVASYLSRHGPAMSLDRIRSAIDTLSIDKKNRLFLVESAYAFRSEAFVPFLISTVDYKAQPYSWEAIMDAQGALEHITFETKVTGKPGWKRWYAKHRNEGRIAWASSAIEEISSALRKDENAALRMFEKKKYIWNDMLILPFVEKELAPRSSFHNSIAGWINLTYEPAYRVQFAPIVQVITRKPELLEKWSRELLINKDFLPGRESRTWEDEVTQSNLHV